MSVGIIKGGAWKWVGWLFLVALILWIVPQIMSMFGLFGGAPAPAEG